MPITTPLTQLLGIKHPILLAPMDTIAGSRLTRAVVDRNAMNGSVSIHTLSPSHARVETLFIQRSAGHQYSALSGFISCLKREDDVIAA